MEDNQLIEEAQNGSMSDEHKAALAQGRVEGRVVRDYLEALKHNKPKRGRKRDPESIQKRLIQINEELEGADALNELLLTSEKRNLFDELEMLGAGGDISESEEAFIAVAKSYSERRNISYATWREIGVSAAVLKRAGVTRSL